ncbi:MULTISPECIES: GNAT family N-acetyltransferase [unclassified Bradyrhizobium]|uniref:GNAT family N-acetyltransferase n=1 Tax=unclassified Bradyrhizobium TaxID=2631580 RepID=UPI0028EC41BA|nr:MULTISPECIES: GNAT family N-acetyltransferase [unclassified Bradyrhizobium]
MIELIPISHVRAGDPYETDVRELVNEAFPEGAPDELGQYYARHGHPHATLLVRSDERIVGHLAIYERQIRCGAEEVTVGLIGEVAVAASHRGRGHARALVDNAHGYLRQRQIPFSILFAFEPRVYASSGYRLIENETRFLGKDGTWQSGVYPGSMVAELMGRRWPDLQVDLCGRPV